MFWAWARVFQVSIPRNLFNTRPNRDNVPHPAPHQHSTDQIRTGCTVFDIHLTETVTDVTRSRSTSFVCGKRRKCPYLSANSIAVSPGFMFWGSKYQTSHTTAHDVINCNRCVVNDCL